MINQINVVGIGGSLATTSLSLKALQIALAGAAEAGAETQLMDVRALALPLYSPDSDEVPKVAREFTDAVAAAAGLLWSSPLYHGTVSGAFKNTLDWLQLLNQREPPFLSNKVVGLISTAGGVQGLQAVNTMEFTVRALRGWAVPMVIPIAQAWQIFDENGEIQNRQVESQLRALGAEVVRASRQFASRGTCDYSESMTWLPRLASKVLL